ncbi:phosphotransferase [Phototrophicus methaneseepsis]|uniref:Phosphotransferase n=1 Tax=Phototrophicus methaneseepsis TaxID=2710758 RepID=A0A7S8IDV8_9CHLR|nr:PHP-associated domain-containing protein [Phototrophicus methaneseepsis]QPC81764.1 phosphotransferase [Phototrophicus methaneseepsis]
MYIPRLGTADLHIHTSASDGVAHVHELLNFITHHRPMLDVIAITDHDTLDASLWAYEGRHQYPFDIVPGVEVSSRGGHVLALWVTTPIPRDMSLPETVAAIHEAGGVAILAHPFHVEIDVSRHNARRHWQHPSVLLDCGLDAIESYNAGVVTPGSNWLAGYFARKIGLTVTGSSDAHTLGAVGTGVTRFTGHTSVHLRAAFAEQRTRAEGRTWPIIEYVNYLRHATQRKAQTSMASTT